MLKKLLVVPVLIALLGLGALRHIQAQSAIVVTLNFEFLRQGTAGVVTLSGEGVVGGVINAFERIYPFFPVTGGFAAFLAVPMEQRIRDYPITVTVYRADGEPLTWEGTVRVASGEFIREPTFVLPSEKLHLLDMAVQESENARLNSIYSVVTPERFWEGQFSLPANAPTTSPFGSVRDFNDGSVRRHTGHDFRMAVGTPVKASASGRVVYARPLDIHGSNVIIDHGWGVFSNYSHLSQIFVVPGQIVLQGEVIGLSGNTGRSTGPHLHWEIAVNGVLINPMDFIRLKMPT
ncbi:MAG: M23 family metallopeptidase [Anaerolineae bacterium]|nr:M23 family metallopeptidase [Anaerolineae bacterium]